MYIKLIKTKVKQKFKHLMLIQILIKSFGVFSLNIP